MKYIPLGGIISIVVIPSTLEAKMPTYEYECKKCNKQFTVFQKSSSQKNEEVSCPYCKTKDIERIISSFNFGSLFGSDCGSSSGFG